MGKNFNGVQMNNSPTIVEKAGQQSPTAETES